MTGSFISIGFDECFEAISPGDTVDVMDRAGRLSTLLAARNGSEIPSAQFSTMAGDSLMFGHMGFVPGIGMCVKTGMQVPSNPARGLDTVQAAVLLFDSKTGEPKALLDGRAITIMRTAGALVAGIREVLSMRSTTAVAPEVAVIGYGAQGRHIAKLAREVLAASRVRAYSPSLATSASGVDSVGSVWEAIEGASVIACATSSPKPVISLDDVRASGDVLGDKELVIGSLNSHDPGKSELDPHIVGASASVHLDLDDPQKFGPVAQWLSGREGNLAKRKPPIHILGQTPTGALSSPREVHRGNAIRTVLIGGHGIQDALMAWSVLQGWPSIREKTQRYMDLDMA